MVFRSFAFFGEVSRSLLYFGKLQSPWSSFWCAWVVGLIVACSVEMRKRASSSLAPMSFWLTKEYTSSWARDENTSPSGSLDSDSVG